MVIISITESNYKHAREPVNRWSVASSGIQAIGMVEFDDGLGPGVLPGGCLYPCGDRIYPRINSIVCRIGYFTDFFKLVLAQWREVYRMLCISRP